MHLSLTSASTTQKKGRKVREYFEERGLFGGNSPVSGIHTLVILSPFIMGSTDLGTWVTVHKNPLTGDEMSRSAPYDRHIYTFGMKGLIYDVRSRRIVGFKRFDENDLDNRELLFHWVAGLRPEG